MEIKTPQERLNAIIAQRMRVRAALEEVDKLESKLESAKTKLKKANEEYAAERSTLEDVIDDKPPGPLFDPDANGDLGAGDGTIPAPIGAETGDDDRPDPADVEEAAATSEASLQKVEKESQSRKAARRVAEARGDTVKKKN